MTTANSSYPFTISAPPEEVVEIDRLARWEVYRRLQELSIPCDCRWGEPLCVRIDNIHAAIQLWCVVQAATASKASLVEHLNACWHSR